MGAEGGRQVGRLTPLRPHAGHEEDRARHQLAQPGEMPRLRGSDDGAHAGQP